MTQMATWQGVHIETNVTASICEQRSTAAMLVFLAAATRVLTVPARVRATALSIAFRNYLFNDRSRKVEGHVPCSTRLPRV